MQPPPVPKSTANGKLISIATVYVKSGAEQRLKELLSAIREEAVTSEEGTLTYRPTQALGEDGVFVVFEEYTGQQALDLHYQGKAFATLGQALEKEQLLDVERGGVKIDYYEEF